MICFYRQLMKFSLLLLLIIPQKSSCQTSENSKVESIASAQLNTQLSEQQRKVKTMGIMNLLMLGGLVIPMGLYILYQRRRQQQLETQLTTLRNQINPHFFSNSLNAIEGLVNLDQKRAASKYLIHFSRLTRRLLNTSLHTDANLAGELETMKHFLALEQLRFKDKLHYDIRVAKDLQPLLIEVPTLIFQPFLENAIWYGIKPKESPGFLQINVFKENEMLCCVIEDDGIGRKAAFEQQKESVMEYESAGGKITKKRLQNAGRGTVQVMDLFDEQGQASGTKVIIRLPYKTYQA